MGPLSRQTTVTRLLRPQLPLKAGLDYFPHDVSLTSDRKFRPLRKRYGYLAPMVYMVLLELIYGDKGYYLDYNDPESVLLDIEERLSGKYQPETETLESVICDLVAQKATYLKVRMCFTMFPSLCCSYHGSCIKMKSSSVWVSEFLQ